MAPGLGDQHVEARGRERLAWLDEAEARDLDQARGVHGDHDRRRPIDLKSNGAFARTSLELDGLHAGIGSGASVRHRRGRVGTVGIAV